MPGRRAATGGRSSAVSRRLPEAAGLAFAGPRMEHARMDAAHFRVGGQDLELTGAHEAYLRGIDGGDFTGDTLAELVRALPPAATILDVGANIGLTTLIMARARAGDSLCAFEPVPSNAGFLRRNLAAAGCQAVTVVESAVGDAPGDIVISDNGPWSNVQASGAGVRIPVTTLDEFCANKLPGVPIALIKIDVEGYEPNVLAGARRIIETFRPTIYMEFNSWTLLLQGYNPLGFAASLMAAFQVTDQAGSALTDPVAFLNQNLKSGFVDDLVLRPRPGRGIPAAEAMKYGAGAAADLHAKIAALKTSTSWRITAPLRALKTALTRR
jgi:FkbM family methyltransferase